MAKISAVQDLQIMQTTQHMPYGMPHHKVSVLDSFVM